jgi:heat shock protein HtpX
VSNATAHLFIANPFGAKGVSGFKKLFSTHPPVEERITALRGMINNK